METEKEIILRISEAMPASAKHVNALFSSDSEIVDIDGGRFLFTIDSFGEEDHFRTDMPDLLGRNLCTCTVSDILACGGRLLFFAHSLTVPKGWDLEYIGRLSSGIAGIITACNGFFAGGDLGSSSQWGFTGVAFGVAERIMTREGARPGDQLYLSGPAGAGNFEAASMLCDRSPDVRTLLDAHRVEFPLRLAESRVMSAYASACIDTSDGLLNALIQLADINGCGFQVTQVPYYPPGVLLTQRLGLPVEILMAGECGEYELLCTVPPEHEPALLEEARRRQLMLYPIGRMTEWGKIVTTGAERRIDAGSFSLSARAYASHEEYLGVLTHYLNDQLAHAR